MHTIGESAFYECKNLQKVIFAEDSQLRDIGKNAFQYCSNLSEVVFTNQCQLEYFRNNNLLKNLTRVSLPKGMENIPQYAFSNGKLEEVHIPASVQSIGESAFYQCKNLQRVTFAEGSQLKEIGEWAFYNTGIAEVHIPASVQSIGESAFEYCESL